MFTFYCDWSKPLVHILEEAQKGTLTPEVAAKAAKVALGLIGNAASYHSRERRKKVLRDMNKDVLSLAEEDDMFTDAECVSAVL